MEVGDHVVTLDDRVEQQDQVQQRLFQIKLMCREPFATEYDDWAAQAIDAALVKASDSGHLG